MASRILLVEDKESLGRMLLETLEGEGFEVEWASTGPDALQAIRRGGRFTAVLSDLRLPGCDGIEILRQSKEVDPECPVVMMTGFGTIEGAVEAMKLGAYDFLEKPFDLDHLTLVLRRCRELRNLRVENLLLRDEYQKRKGFPEIIGDSEAIVQVSRAIQKVAPTDSTVLLEGESGTGKELFARAVHQISRRRDKPFVAINCAAIPDSLIENELFGHEKGAYTGAGGRQIGKFELADSGTIFLDEIAELGIGVQSKILRVLQERKFERVGGVATVEVDIRVICATNRNLSEAVREGEFRDDLFFRVNVFPVTIPPLRARKDDLGALTDHFLAKFARELGKGSIEIAPAASQLLAAYDWPGNIRELENCIERAVILCERNRIEPGDFNLAPGPRAGDALREYFDLSGTMGEATDRVVRSVERIKIEDALRSGGSKVAAAEILGLTPRILLNKMKEYGIETAVQ